VERLLQDGEVDETREGWLNTIKRNSQRLLQLVNQLLDIARLDAGHLKLVLEYGDILKPLRILVNGYQSLAETNYLRLVLDIPDEELIHWFDRDKIEKIVANLLSNALKYTPVHGIVTCRIRIISGIPFTTKNPAIRILVADNGHGIPENEKMKIFDRYYRTKSARQAESGGTGVGLAVTRELVELLHGDLVLKSREEKGSVFIATIPLGKDHLIQDEFIIREEKETGVEKVLSSEEVSEIRSDEYPVANDLMILVIDDNEEVRSFIIDSLKSDYKILQATDGFLGWETATSDLPDLIITDIMMPGMDGFELCKKLKHDERTSHIPVIMLTARAMSSDRLEGLETGADDYIIKPFSMEELSVRIRNLLEQREKLKEKYSNLIKLNLGALTVTTLDDQFLKKVTTLISKNLHDFRFDVSTMQEKMNMSSSNLYRKIKALTGESPVQLLRNMRLNLAAELIQKNNHNITEVMLQVGFSNLSYFSRSFKSLYGVTPKVFQRSHSRKAKPFHQSP
jgi:DNA-binding response OmpR family regulator